MIQLIIFDFDGVLCPLNYRLIFDVYRHIAREMDCPEVWGDSIESFKKWFDIQYLNNLTRMGISDSGGILRAEQLFREYLTARGHNMFPEMDSILPDLARAYDLAVLSNGPEVRVLEQVRNPSWFKAIIGNETVGERTKPDPHGILLCMEKLGSTPESTAIIGDHPVDILAGGNAGLKYKIGVAWGMGEEKDLREAGADRILGEIGEIRDLERMFRL